MIVIDVMFSILCNMYYVKVYKNIIEKHIKNVSSVYFPFYIRTAATVERGPRVVYGSVYVRGAAMDERNCRRRRWGGGGTDREAVVIRRNVETPTRK